MEAEEVCRSIAYDDPDLRSYKIPVASRIAAYAITSESWEEDCCDSLGCLPGRNKTDVVWFIQDCILELDNTDGHPDIIGGHLVQVGGGYLRLVPPRKWHTIRTQVVPTSKLRLKHEIGNGLAGWASGGIREPLRLLKDRMRDTMPAWMYVNEGSSDLMSIAWSPDGQRFGLGCKLHLLFFLR